MNYPARGETSEDRHYYTHTNGTVYERVPVDECQNCSFVRTGKCHKVRCVTFKNGYMAMFKLVEGAYVQSAEESEACDMARAHITMCETHHISHDGCEACCEFGTKKCHLRKYLAKHGATDAWEVKE